MVDPRIYRAALLPVLFALVLLAFSLENRPRPLTTPSRPTRSRATARSTARTRRRAGLADRFPDRRPGSARRRGARRRVAAEMPPRRAFACATSSARARRSTASARCGRSSPSARARSTSGSSSSPTATPPARGPTAELSGTAALLELARVFGAPRQTRRTLTLVSTSGGSGGAAGRGRSPTRSAGPVGAVLVLGDLASRNVRAPFVTPWSNALGGAPLRLRATVQEARARRDRLGRGPAARADAVRALRAARDLRRAGRAAGGRPAGGPAVGRRRPSRRAPARRSRAQRLEAFGRAALRTVTVLDAAPQSRPLNPETTSRDLLTSRKVVPGWAVRLFTGALLLAVLRSRRPTPSRRCCAAASASCAWLRWTLAGALPFLLAALFALALGATGSSRRPARPSPPARCRSQLPALLAVALVFVARAGSGCAPRALRVMRGRRRSGRAGRRARRRARRARRDDLRSGSPTPTLRRSSLPRCTSGCSRSRPSSGCGGRSGIAVVALGALPLALVVRGARASLGLGLVQTCWEGLLLVAGGHISALSVLLWSLLAGCGASALLIAARGRARRRAAGADHRARADELRGAGLARRHRVGAENDERRAAASAGALDGPHHRRRADARRRGADRRSGRSRSRPSTRASSRTASATTCTTSSARSPSAVEHAALEALASERRRMAFLARRLRVSARARRRGRAHPDPEDRRELRRRRRHGHRDRCARARASTTRCRSPGRRGRRRSPGTARRTSRRFATSTSSSGRRDHRRDALRALHVRGRAQRIVAPTEVSVIKRVGLRPPRAVGLPPALQRRAADRRLRPPRRRAGARGGRLTLADSSGAALKRGARGAR